MKGLLSLLLILMFVLSACGNSQQTDNADESQATGGTTETDDTERDDITEDTTEFLERFPLTLDTTDYANREKHAHLDFTIDDSDLENIQYPYEIGNIIYYPPSPTFTMYYDHDGREISAGMEVIARLDEEGIAILGSYENAVKVTVELSN